MNKSFNVDVLSNINIDTNRLLLETDQNIKNKNSYNLDNADGKLIIKISRKLETKEDNLKDNLEDNLENKEVGFIMLTHIEKRIEIKIFIDKEHRNQGYATEALNAITTHLKNINPKYKNKFFAKASIEEIEFARVLVKCGFSYQEKTNEFIYKDRKKSLE